MINYGFAINATGNAIVIMNGIGSGAANLEHKVQKHTSEIGHHFKSMFSEIKGMAAGMIGIYGVFEFVKGSVEAYNKLDEAEVKLNAQLKSTGQIAGLNKEKLLEMADTLSGKVIFPKSDIIEAEGMLSMFKTLNKETYEKTLPLAADLATKFGMGIPESARMLGRSLENLDLGRLQMRLGKLTDAQKAQIKYFKESGQTAKAQSLIYDFIKGKVGGLSEEIAKTPEGQLKMASKYMEDIRVGFGGIFMSLMVRLIPTFKKMVDVFKSMMPHIKAMVEAFVTKLTPILEKIKKYFVSMWPVVKELFQAAIGGIAGFLDVVQFLLPALKYIVDLFLFWKGIQLFNFLVDGVQGLFIAMKGLPALVNSVGAGFNSWTIPLLTVLATLFLVKDAIDQIKIESNLKNLAQQQAAKNNYISELQNQKPSKERDEAIYKNRLELEELKKLFLSKDKDNGASAYQRILNRSKENIQSLLDTVKGLYTPTSPPASGKSEDGKGGGIGKNIT